MFSLTLIITVLVLLFGSLPVWRYSRRWGYRVSAWMSSALLVLFLMLLMGLL